MQGVVKKWFDDKGFGFIEAAGESKDLFVHQSNIKMEGFRTLEEGQTVEFDKGQGNKGPEAVEVVPMQGDQNWKAPAKVRLVEEQLQDWQA